MHLIGEKFPGQHDTDPDPHSAMHHMAIKIKRFRLYTMEIRGEV